MCSPLSSVQPLTSEVHRCDITTQLHADHAPHHHPLIAAIVYQETLQSPIQDSSPPFSSPSLRRLTSPSHRGGVTLLRACSVNATHTHTHKYVPSALCIISLRYLSARLTSPRRVRPHPPSSQEERQATSCVYITRHLPQPTNQEPEQPGRLWKHIVTDLYARLCASWPEPVGRRRMEGVGGGASAERSFQCRASPSACVSVCVAFALASCQHTHTPKQG